ncbi:hypothetical protein [Solimicrobium silvestre]|uniref:Uncharacterized protein n=1 Tax=Solimicrobium silvestre TaxID=2099400 RepID=A0A2S9GTF3_9BURK|nr:hypothetical protein [Solimicrobium silvestre]PRC90990.1 hypothetical protein S2091_4286 [Solimicrobium silvestre]
MYPDTKRLRHNRIMVSLDDYEHDLINALANYRGESLAVIARQMIMREAVALLTADHADSLSRRSA